MDTDELDEIEKMMLDTADAAPPADEDSLAAIRRMAEEVNTIDAQLARIAEITKLASERRNRLLGRDMIELMDEVRVEDLSVAGRKFTASSYVHASIPKDKTEEAHDWLEKNEAGDLIKYEIVTTFPKDCEDEASRLRDYIRQNFQIANVETKRGVPWARLTSWVKERLEQGLYTPLELLGANTGRVVKIKEPKAR